MRALSAGALQPASKAHATVNARARDVIARCNAAGVKVVAGGTLFTHEHEAFDGVDHFVLNEAEITLPPFLADLAAGRAQPIYRSAEFADVHRTPVPRWDLAEKPAAQRA